MPNSDAFSTDMQDRDRGETRSNDFSCDEALHGICGSNDTERCGKCGRFVCPEHWAEHTRAHPVIDVSRLLTDQDLLGFPREAA